MITELAAPASDRILLFIPAYRCHEQIGRVLNGLQEHAAQRWFAEILIVDNVSPDGTADRAIEAATDAAMSLVTIVRNRANYGLGGSHKVAFQYAIDNKFTHIAVLHGDDQGDIRDLLLVLQAGRHRDHDCCLGARFQAGAKRVGYSGLRTFGNYAFNALFSLGTLRRLTDLGSGLNLYKVESLESGYWLKFYDNLMFNYCMILAHCQRQDRILFFPITWREEDQVSNVKLFSQAYNTLILLGSYVKSPEDFMRREFRQKPPEQYEFEILALRL